MNRNIGYIGSDDMEQDIGNTGLVKPVNTTSHSVVQSPFFSGAAASFKLWSASQST